MDALDRTHRRQPSKGGLWLLGSLGVFYSSYLVIRYGGLWSENDTAIFTHDAILTARYHSTIFPTQYPHGFGYQLWLAMMQLTTHLPAAFINTTILPFIGVSLTILLAYVTYLELMENLALSQLATFLILAVPDIMFTLLRGNHEKLTVALILANVFVLVRFLKSTTTKERCVWEIGFYLLVATNGVVNDYFTVFVVWGMIVYLLIAGLFAWRTGYPKPGTFLSVARLILISVGIIALDVWIVFPPARIDAYLLMQTIQKLKTLFTTQQIASNPLSASVQQWVDIPVYLVVSGFRWIVVGGSFLVWLLMLIIPLRRKEPLSPQSLIMTSMYAATAASVVIAVPVDLTGLAAGTNLEFRNYTYFALFAVPFVAIGVSGVTATMSPKWHRKGARTFITLLVPFFLIISMLKATLDPLISNQWLFYSPSEKQAVLFYLRHRSQGPGLLWAGPDQRLSDAAATWWPGLTPWYVAGGRQPVSPLFSLWLWSPNIAVSAVELKDPLPDYAQQNLIYSNGQAKIYAKIPASPFEVAP